MEEQLKNMKNDFKDVTIDLNQEEVCEKKFDIDLISLTEEKTIDLEQEENFCMEVRSI